MRLLQNEIDFQTLEKLRKLQSASQKNHGTVQTFYSLFHHQNDFKESVSQMDSTNYYVILKAKNKHKSLKII